MNSKIIKLLLILLVLLLVITPIVAESKGLQSFEDYPTGPFPETDSY